MSPIRTHWLRTTVLAAMATALLIAAPSAMAADSYRCTIEGRLHACTIPDGTANVSSKYRGYARVKGRTCPPGAYCIMAAESPAAYAWVQRWVWSNGWQLQGDWRLTSRTAGTIVFVEPWSDGWVWTRSQWNSRTRSYDWMAMRADKLAPATAIPYR
jgi:hypothetical protein